MDEQGLLGNYESDAELPIVYYVPLSPFERQLLHDLTSLLDQREYFPFDPQNAPIVTTFQKWNWSHLVGECLSDDLGGDGLSDTYNGDRGSAYRAFLHFMAHQGEGEQSLARMQCLQQANKTFLSQLGERPISDVKVLPAADDEPFWETLSRLYHTYGRFWFYEDTLSNGHGNFEIWKLIRQFTIQWNWPENIDLIDQILITNDSFQALYEIHSTDLVSNRSASSEVESEQLVIRKRQLPESRIRWPEGEPNVGEDGLYTEAYVKFLLRSLGQIHKVEDPRTYLHFIPWDELILVKPEFLRASDIDLNVPPLQENAFDEWALWTPPYPGFIWNHHLRTEDEVYEYNVLNNWPFPDHYLHHQVIFAVRELDKTEFLAQMTDFWDNWNDCALTQRSENGPILLLETIPGLRFRSRHQNQDSIAAQVYYRNLVEAHATNDLETSNIKAILGLELAYNPLFKHSLRVIQEDQLFDISWDAPLGKGANGAVYSAKWRKPAGILATTRQKDQEIQVVLKDVIPRNGASRDTIKKLLKELDLTYAGLGGNAVGCVDFLGIALFQLESTNANQNDGKAQHFPSHQDRKIFLVFEQATQGTIINFLSKQLKDLPFVECWEHLVVALSNIANGIMSLHRHGVLHRDLHMNNILVTDRYFPNDPQIPHEYSYIISDIGEGKVLNSDQEIRDPTHHRASYGAIEFRAPEVSGNVGWSPEAEIFSFGVIATKILEWRRYESAPRPPERILSIVKNKYPEREWDADSVAHLVPAKLKHALEPCMSYSPTDRPSIREVIRNFEDLQDDFTADLMNDKDKSRVTWDYWQWNESLRRGRRPPIREERNGNADQEIDEYTDIGPLPDYSRDDV